MIAQYCRLPGTSQTTSDDRLTLARDAPGLRADVFDDRLVDGIALRRPDLSGLIDGVAAAGNKTASGCVGQAFADVGDVLGPLSIVEGTDPVGGARITGVIGLDGSHVTRVGAAVGG